MDAGEDLRPALRQQVAGLLGRLAPSDREALLIKNWMSHDARWFMAVAAEFGMQVTNRLNQRAAHEVGTVEARRIVRALGLPPVTTLDDYLLVQEVFIGLLGPDLLDYRVTKVGDHAFPASPAGSRAAARPGRLPHGPGRGARPHRCFPEIGLASLSRYPRIHSYPQNENRTV